VLLDLIGLQADVTVHATHHRPLLCPGGSAKAGKKQEQDKKGTVEIELHKG
jgi:hypothetical protein